MRLSGQWPIILLTLLWVVPRGFGSDKDDSILTEQILVAVNQCRVIEQDYARLLESLRKNPSIEGDVMEYPSVMEFIRVSLVPSQNAVQDLLIRYKSEYGERALQKLAKKNQFTDLLP